MFNQDTYARAMGKILMRLVIFAIIVALAVFVVSTMRELSDTLIDDNVAEKWPVFAYLFGVLVIMLIPLCFWLIKNTAVLIRTCVPTDILAPLWTPKNQRIQNNELEMVRKYRHKEIRLWRMAIAAFSVSTISLLMFFGVDVLSWTHINPQYILWITRTGMSVSSLSLLWLVSIIVHIRSNHIQKVRAEQIFVKSIISQSLRVIKYHPSREMPEKYGFHLAIAKDWDDCIGSDLIHGIYNEADVTFCNATLYDNTDIETLSQQVGVPVFMGQWIDIKLPRPLKHTLTIHEKGALGTSDACKNIIETESHLFNERFLVTTDAKDELEAFSILTPALIQYILDTDSQANGIVSIHFQYDRVYIAINSGRLFFHVGNCTKPNKEIAQIEADIQYITDVVDIFLQNEYLFPKRKSASEVSEKAQSRKRKSNSTSQANTRKSKTEETQLRIDV